MLARLNLIPGVWVWRQNVGRARMASGRWVRFGLSGQADVCGVVRRADGLGVALFLEMKSELGAQSDEQRAFEAKAVEHGAVYRVVRSLGDAFAAVALARGAR